MRILAYLAIVTTLSVGCNDNGGVAARTLSIFSPTGSVCPTADANPTTAGLQIDVIVETTGFADGDLVNLVDGTNVLGSQAVTANRVTFKQVTLAGGNHMITAQSADMKVSSAVDTVAVESTAPSVSITKPGDGVTVTIADDTSTATAGIQLAVKIATSAADGTKIALNGHSSSGHTAPTAMGTAMSGAATITITLDDEGGWTLTASLSDACQAAAASMVTVVVSGMPGTPGALMLSQAKRNTMNVAWTAPASGTGGTVDHCLVKVSPRVIIDNTTFEGLATAATVPGVAAGQQMQANIAPLKTATPWFFAVRCFDAGGAGGDLISNSAAATLAIKPGVTLAPVSPTTNAFVVTNAQFGTALAGGDLDHDGKSDLAVGAPRACKSAASCSDPTTFGEGLVYVYLGRTGGIAATPDFILEGTEASKNESFGQSLVTLDWNGDGIADLAVGAPAAAGKQGKVFIFLGGGAGHVSWTTTAGTPKVIHDTQADVTITVDQSDAWLNGETFFGWSLATLDFDGDNRPDLLIGTPGVEEFAGGAVIIFGPPAGTIANIAVPSGLNGAGTSAEGFRFTGAIPGGGEYGTTITPIGRGFAIAPLAGDFQQDTAPTVYVFHGGGRPASALGLPQTLYVLADEGYNPRYTQNIASLAFGECLTSIDDQDSDGHRELVITDPLDSGIGYAWIDKAGLGGSFTADMDAYAAPFGPSAQSHLGEGCAGGDVDLDGIQDLVVTSDADSFDGPAAPHLFVWWGGRGTAAAFGDHVTAPSAFKHSTIAAFVGDLDGDGLPDIAWGDDMNDATVTPEPGSVQILY